MILLAFDAVAARHEQHPSRQQGRRQADVKTNRARGGVVPRASCARISSGGDALRWSIDDVLPMQAGRRAAAGVTVRAAARCFALGVADTNVQWKRPGMTRRLLRMSFRATG